MAAVKINEKKKALLKQDTQTKHKPKQLTTTSYYMAIDFSPPSSSSSNEDPYTITFGQSRYEDLASEALTKHPIREEEAKGVLTTYRLIPHRLARLYPRVECASTCERFAQPVSISSVVIGSSNRVASESKSKSSSVSTPMSASMYSNLHFVDFRQTVAETATLFIVHEKDDLSVSIGDTAKWSDLQETTQLDADAPLSQHEQNELVQFRMFRLGRSGSYSAHEIHKNEGTVKFCCPVWGGEPVSVDQVVRIWEA